VRTERGKACDWRQAFSFFTLYVQNTKFERVYCQIWAGILAFKPFGISRYYLGFGGRGLTEFPQTGEKCHIRLTILAIGDVCSTELVEWELQRGAKPFNMRQLRV
jgi:hypothetical protein